MSRRVMFVDDEPHLLAGLRRGLRVKRREWDVLFATSGEEALALLAEQSVDVVISDMRMPGMDGARLLAEVRRSFPGTARMILSGHADRTSIISAVGPTQQYLTKPCDVDVLVAAVERVLEVRELIHDVPLRDLLGGVESLPKPPQIYQQMMAISADPDCSLDDVVEVIERDLGTSAEVLRLVNSSFFGLPVRVESMGRAVSLLGLETIQGLAVAGAVFGRGGTPPPGLDPGRLCSEGLHVGTLAKRFALSEGWPSEAVNDAFFAGLLHRVALPVLAAAHSRSWAEVRRARPRDPWQAHQVEVAAFGHSVTRATGYLLGLWGFAEGVVEAIAEQPAALDDPTATPASLALTVARWHATVPADQVRLRQPHPETCFLTDHRLQQWLDSCADLEVTPEAEQQPAEAVPAGP